MFCLFNRKLQKLVPSQNLSQLKLENHMFSHMFHKTEKNANLQIIHVIPMKIVHAIL